MANNLIQIKRTSVSGRAANTTTLTNPGELALNMTDGIMYSTNGSVVFEVGANLTSIAVGNSTSRFVANTTRVAIGTSQGLLANGSVGTNGQVLTSNGTTVYWASGSSGVNAQQTVYTYTLAANATIIQGADDNAQTLNYSAGLENVFINGSRQIAGVDYNTTNATAITLLDQALAGEVVQIVAWQGSVAAVNTSLQYAWTNTHSFSNTVTFTGAISANGTLGTAGQVLHSNGTALYWAADDNAGGTVTSIATANGLSGGTITTSGTLGVTTGSTLTVNTTGIHVNSALSITSLALAGALSGVTTLAAGNTTITGFVNATSTVNASGLAVGTSFIANTTGAYHTGTVNAASLAVGTAFVANTTRVVIGTSTGLQANGGIGTAGQVLTSNATTVYWSTPTTGTVTSIATANGLSGGTITSSGTLGVTTGPTLTVNTTGIHVNSTLSLTDLTLSGNLTVSGTRTYVNTTTLDVGDNIITLNADLGAAAPTQDAGIEIMRGTSSNVQFMWDETNDRWTTNGQPLAISSLVATGAASGITTLAAGNTTITGFVNATASVNSAILAVGTSFIANTTGAYHTGIVNAATYTVGTAFTANSVSVRMSSNSVFSQDQSTGTGMISGVLSYNPEGYMATHPFLTNDLANLRLRGGTLTVNTNVTLTNTQFDTLFDATPTYTTGFANTTANTILEFTLPTTLFWGSAVGISFGASSWAPSYVAIDAYSNGVWVSCYSNTAFTGSQVQATIPGNAGPGTTALRFTMSANSSTRIAGIWGYDYDSDGWSQAAMPRAGGQFYGNVSVNSTSQFSIGSTVINATSFSGTANNATNFGGYTWAAPGALGTTTANTGTFTSVTVGTSFIANTTRVVIGTATGLQANGGIGTAGQVLTSNATTVYWSTPTTGTVTSIATANGLSGGTITSSGTLGVTTGSTLTVNTTGIHVNSALSITSLALAGALSGVTTLAAGNTTITGFVNATSTVNASGLAVGTSFIANTTGAYHTGTVNAASYTVGTTFTANATLVNAAALNVVNQVNTATLYAATSANIASVVQANSTGIFTTGTANAASLTVGTSFVANTTRVVVGTSTGLQANGGIGSDGQVLKSNATSVYWDTQRLQTAGQNVVSGSKTLGSSDFGTNILATTAGITITLPSSGAVNGTTVIISNISGGNITIAYAFAGDGPTTLANGETIWFTCDGNPGSNYWRRYFNTTPNAATTGKAIAMAIVFGG